MTIQNSYFFCIFKNNSLKYNMVKRSALLFQDPYPVRIVYGFPGGGDPYDADDISKMAQVLERQKKGKIVADWSWWSLDSNMRDLGTAEIALKEDQLSKFELPSNRQHQIVGISVSTYDAKSKTLISKYQSIPGINELVKGYNDHNHALISKSGDTTYNPLNSISGIKIAGKVDELSNINYPFVKQNKTQGKLKVVHLLISGSITPMDNNEWEIIPPSQWTEW